MPTAITINEDDMPIGYAYGNNHGYRQGSEKRSFVQKRRGTGKTQRSEYRRIRQDGYDNGRKTFTD